MFSSSHPHLFSQSDSLQRGLQIPNDRLGGIRTIRLKSRAEQSLLNSKSKEGTCTFCRATGHNIGSNCAALTSFKAHYYHKKSKKFEFATTLGDAAVHLVKHASVALIYDIFQNIILAEALIPKDAHHVVVKHVHFSAAFLNQSRVRVSAYACQATNTTLPSREDNIVEILCLEEGGAILPDKNGDHPQFVTVATMKGWIQSSSNKKLVLSQLNNPNKVAEDNWEV